MAAVAAPVSLEQIADLDAGMVFPRQALSESSTALCLFSAAWHGRQDAYWVAKAGLAGRCLDLDAGRLAEMRAIYPDDWIFEQADAFTWQWDVRRLGDNQWDVVTLDPFTTHFDRCADMLDSWCRLARNVVILGMDDRELDVPDGWQIVQRRKRSNYNGGVWWIVLEPTGQGITPDKVSACLITRGDVSLEPILATLPYDEVLIWDARERTERPGTFGRYQLMREATHEVVYLQDDDCVFDRHEELMRAYNPGRITAVYGHGDTPDGYDDMALIHGGALVDRDVSLRAFDRYREVWEEDDGFYREADMIHGTLSPFTHVHLPYTIRMDIAQHPSRMCNQPWQKALKLRITDRAREVRKLSDPEGDRGTHT